MCDCIDVEPGSYDNEIMLEIPDNVTLRYNAPGQEVRKTVCIDQCLAEEIQHLWSLGITTTGCCCGHNKTNGLIGVIDDDIQHMKDIGYEVVPNPSRPGDEEIFYPLAKFPVQEPKQ